MIKDEILIGDTLSINCKTLEELTTTVEHIVTQKEVDTYEAQVITDSKNLLLSELATLSVELTDATEEIYIKKKYGMNTALLAKCTRKGVIKAELTEVHGMTFEDCIDDEVLTADDTTELNIFDMLDSIMQENVLLKSRLDLLDGGGA